ncbi:TonB-dependent receptor [Pedobacter sp. ASV1-7]|uniref:TonB-dependent receptor n=1 Tax=Pedobacter sp. ASV1-7 TaxID=3145237 RepID=UPI0032E8F907
MYLKKTKDGKPIGLCSNILLIMRLSTIILIASLMQVSAAGLAQKVNLSEINTPLKLVLKELKRQSRYNFVITDAQLRIANPVNIHVKNMQVEQVLVKIFDQQPLLFEIDNKTVVVRDKGPSFLDRMVRPWTTVDIRGQILDEQKKPMPGATVRIKGANQVAITDQNGKFVLKDVANEAILVVQYVGYKTREVPLKDVKNGSPIILFVENAKLDEIVVVGYGEVKRGDLTGAVGTVNINDLNKAPIATFDQALAGRIAGVQVTSKDGQPGEQMNIVIRGGNSLTQSNAPLYVVDGFPMENFSVSSINPLDIKSINILKDASATAIYGSRGANGVVIIDTKQGSIGDPVINYEGFIGTQNTIARMDLMSPYEFVKYQIELDPASMTKRYLTDRMMVLEDYKNIDGIDWQDKFFREALMQNHAISLRGGSQKTKYAVSLSTTDQDGVIKNSGFQRNVGRVTLNQDIGSRLKANLIVNYSRDKNFGSITSSQATSEGGYASYLMYRVWGYRPISFGTTDIVEDLFDEEIDGADGAYILTMNPIITTENEIRQQNRANLFTSLALNYDLTKDLKLSIRGGYTNVSTVDEAFYNSKTWQGYPSATNRKGVNGKYQNVELTNWMNENTLNYKKKLNSRNQLDVLVGATIQGAERKDYGYEAYNIPNEELKLKSLQLGLPASVISTGSENALISFLGRINYNLNSKYLFTASIRSDGSSKFSRSKRWGTFPSAAFAWQLGRESFLKNSRFISDSKLRLSYGITGNNRINDFARYTTLDIDDYYSFGNATPGYAALLSNLGNESLKWERTAQWDLGYEISLFNNRINIEADVYRKTTKDLLLYSDLPYSTGFNRVYRNVGSVQNDGLEISINTVNIASGDFKWTSDFNISFNKNKVIALSDNQNSFLSSVNFTGDFNTVPLYITKIGAPVSSFYGVVWDGVYQYEDFDKLPNGYVLKQSVPTNGSDRSLIQPGDIKYKDQNGDGVVDEDDRVVIGRTLPKHFGGFNNNFSYKNFSLNVFFQWNYGNNIMNANRMLFEGSYNNRLNLNQFRSYETRWTAENQSNVMYRTRGAGPMGVYSSRTIEDGSFLRLKTVRFTYSIPKKSIKGIDNASVFLAGQNIYTWDRYSGMDPEVSTRQTALTPGFDYSAYARSLTFTVGTSITF